MLFNRIIEEADRCADLLASSRTRSGVSRKAMSAALGVSESTIKAWECGQGAPTLPGLLEWFRVAGESPLRPMLDFFWPDVFAGLAAGSSDEEILDAGRFYFEHVAGPVEIQKLHYLIFGDHGSAWPGLLDMACTHTHTSLNSRYRVAEIIQTSYEMSAANGRCLTPPGFRVDRPLLLNAINEAKEAAVVSCKNGYVIGRNSENISALLAKARIDSGATQKELAKALGKTQQTIQKWETGYNPSFLELCKWFRVLNMPAWTYIHCMFYPAERLTFHESDEKRRGDVVAYLSTCGSSELRKLFYVTTAPHGSNWMAVLEMMLEHVCSPMAQRVISARSVLIGYQIEQRNHQLLEPGYILPDIENLDRCIVLGTEAAKRSRGTYRDLLIAESAAERGKKQIRSAI